MRSDQDISEFIASSGIVRVEAVPMPNQPLRFLSDGSTSSSRQNSDRGHRSSRDHHVRRSRIRKGKRLLTAMIPFIIFMVGISLLSVGFFAYVENESVLALFITSRDNVPADTLHGLDSSVSLPSVSLPSAPTETTALVSEPGTTLVVPFFYDGDQFGTISIPSVDIAVNAYQGDSEDEFQLGAGHYAGSFFPGQGGNIVIASHRTTYFRPFEDLKTGDLVEFETTYGHFTYQVREIKILKDDFSEIVKATPKEQLTMYTCYPFTYIGNAPNRFVVMCDLIESELNT